MADKDEVIIDAEVIENPTSDLVRYEEKYSDSSFMNKVLKYGKAIGLELLYKAAQLYYVLQKPDLPPQDKALIIGALGYLISPLDLIPDVMLVAGYTDDAAVLFWAVTKVYVYIDDKVRMQARELLAKVFSPEDIAKL